MKEKAISSLDKSFIPELNKKIVVLDIESTGFSPTNDRIVEFGAVKLENGKPIDSMSVLINPEKQMHYKVIEVHNITNEMVADKPTERYYAPIIYKFLEDCDYIVGHNVNFDLNFIENTFQRNGLDMKFKYIDTLELAKKIYLNAPNYKLDTLAEYLGIKIKDAHRALADVETTVWLLRYMAYEVMKS